MNWTPAGHSALGALQATRQTPLLLEAAGGETLVRFLPGPMEMTQFLRRTVGLTTAIGGLHKRELIPVAGFTKTLAGKLYESL
jgi:hypothetical protein